MPKPVMHPVLAFGHHLDDLVWKWMVAAAGYTNWTFRDALISP
jgi:hypothetical protein